MSPARSSRRTLVVRDGVLPRLLRRALTDSGTPAVEAFDLPIPGRGQARTVEELSLGRTVVMWDLEYLDPERFPLRNHEGVLVLRISEAVPVGVLVPRIVQLVHDLRDRGSPTTVLVLDLWTSEFRSQGPARAVA